MVTKAVIKRSDFKNFKEFFPYYLEEHSNRTNRRLHVIGTLTAGLLLAYLLFTAQYKLLFLPFVVGYGFAWVGHFFFEKNKPATFKHPFYSFRGDWHMLYMVLSGRIPF
mmetsp:Transcript_135029/g.190950  ORF Transcript_135029/g.190950 Transcript_135029/m.190950 type:complete len:109 (-) Transcript_135029:73-399(-)